VSDQCRETVGTLTSLVNSSDIMFFNGGDPLPAGKYEVEYVDGCMKYFTGGNSGWTVNAYPTPDPFGYGYYIGATSGDKLQQLPGTSGFRVGDPSQVSNTGAFDTIIDCVNANQALALIMFNLTTGGPLGIWLDDTNYGDNVEGTPNPTWKLTSLECRTTSTTAGPP
jgi:hypothetical protein